MTNEQFLQLITVTEDSSRQPFMCIARYLPGHEWPRVWGGSRTGWHNYEDRNYAAWLAFFDTQRATGPIELLAKVLEIPIYPAKLPAVRLVQVTVPVKFEGYASVNILVGEAVGDPATEGRSLCEQIATAVTNHRLRDNVFQRQPVIDDETNFPTPVTLQAEGVANYQWGGSYIRRLSGRWSVSSTPHVITGAIRWPE